MIMARAMSYYVYGCPILYNSGEKCIRPVSSTSAGASQAPRDGEGPLCGQKDVLAHPLGDAPAHLAPGVRRSLASVIITPMPPSLQPLSLEIVLWEPEIPPNTGNIARTCACTGCKLHLAGPLGFQMRNADARRAGLDYWAMIEWKRWLSLDEMFKAHPKVLFPLPPEAWINPITNSAAGSCQSREEEAGCRRSGGETAQRRGSTPKTAWFYSTKGVHLPWEIPIRQGDFLVFGPETRGLSEALLAAAGGQTVAFPQVEGTRSLNVSNAVCAAIYFCAARQYYL